MAATIANCRLSAMAITPVETFMRPNPPERAKQALVGPHNALLSFEVADRTPINNIVK
jgi:hypothetical protein